MALPELPPLPVHPYAELFPMLDDDALADLAEDIRKHGLRERLIAYQGMLLDGRNRRAACEIAGVEPKYDNHFGDDDSALALVISKNLKRRHLTTGQKAMLGVRLLEIEKEAAKKRQGTRTDLVETFPPGPTDPEAPYGRDFEGKPLTKRQAEVARRGLWFYDRPPPEGFGIEGDEIFGQGPADFGKARDKAGEKIGTSGRSIEKAAKLVKQADPVVVSAVTNGQITLEAATAAARLPPEQQRDFAAKLDAGVAPKKAMQAVKREAAREAEIEAAEKAAEGRDPIDGISLYLGDVDNALASMLAAPSPPELVTADPPWKYSNTGTNGAVGERYDGLPTAVIVEQVAFAYQVAADNAYLALWITKPFLEEWFKATAKMADMWRWRFVTGMSWGKRDAEGVEAGSRIGAGFHVRGDCEDVLIYVKGRPPRPREALSSWWVSDRLAHSEKPMDMQRAMVRAWTEPGGEGGVLDMYSGRFSMGRACLAEGRRCRGAEIDPERHREAMALLRGRVGL